MVYSESLTARQCATQNRHLTCDAISRVENRYSFSDLLHLNQSPGCGQLRVAVYCPAHTSKHNLHLQRYLICPLNKGMQHSILLSNLPPIFNEVQIAVYCPAYTDNRNLHVQRYLVFILSQKCVLHFSTEDCNTASCFQACKLSALSCKLLSTAPHTQTTITCMYSAI